MKFLWYLLKNILMGLEIYFSGGSNDPPGWTVKGGILATVIIASFIVLYLLVYFICRKAKKYEAQQSRKMAGRFLLCSILLFVVVCIIGELIIENI